eukprot:TRINITY_DN494_c0_g1_i1.p1 TRINITY_DN494_c0_g1~~TRINITY_DN494_c0_g1_i1.p1  ORF type:complete len:182 (-),score=44.77 TRINITY_DN494_c0_g1_i1:395-940(-)
MSRRGNILTRVEGLLDSGVWRAEPKWLDTVRKIPPTPSPYRTKNPEPIVYEEDQLHLKYLRKQEGKSLEVFRLIEGSGSRPSSFEFVQRQMELIKEGHSENEAYDIAEKELNKKRMYKEIERDLAEEQAVYFGAKPSLTLLEKLHQQEEKELGKAQNIERQKEKKMEELEKMAAELDGMKL